MERRRSFSEVESNWFILTRGIFSIWKMSWCVFPSNYFGCRQLKHRLSAEVIRKEYLEFVYFFDRHMNRESQFRNNMSFYGRVVHALNLISLCNSTNVANQMHLWSCKIISKFITVENAIKWNRSMVVQCARVKINTLRSRSQSHLISAIINEKWNKR